MGRTSRAHGRLSRAAAGLAAALAALAALSGCSSGQSSAHKAQVVRITERDFAISIAKRHLAAGEFDLAVDNRGPVSHELIVVRSDTGALPLRSDGITVNEEALEAAEVGALEPGKPGTVRHLRVRLKPGRYEVFCNMAGHYFGGMRTQLVVS